MNCPRCGKETSHKWNFCSKCGLQLKEKIVVVQYNRPDGTETENRLAKLFKEKHPETEGHSAVGHEEIAEMLEIMQTRAEEQAKRETGEAALEAWLEAFALADAVFCVRVRYGLGLRQREG